MRLHLSRIAGALVLLGMLLRVLPGYNNSSLLLESYKHYLLSPMIDRSHDENSFTRGSISSNDTRIKLSLDQAARQGESAGLHWAATEKEQKGATQGWASQTLEAPGTIKNNWSQNETKGTRGSITFNSTWIKLLSDQAARQEENTSLLATVKKKFKEATQGWVSQTTEAPGRHKSQDESLKSKEAWKSIVPTAVMYMPYAGYENFNYNSITDSFDKSYMNGLKESPFIRLANLSETAELILQNKPVGWIHSTAHLKPIWACGSLFTNMKAVQEIVWKSRPTCNSPTWHVGMLDENDHGWAFFNCPMEMDTFLRNISKTVTYWKRGMVKDRSFNETTQTLDPGKLHDGIVNLPPYPGQDKPSPTLSTMPLHHTPINVRTDMVQAVLDILANDPNYAGQNLTLASHIESVLPRPTDVTHFFPPTLHGYRDEAPSLAKLRLAVSQTILSFAKAEKNQGNQIAVFVKKLGENAEKGRKEPQQGYIKQLLCTKIAIVAQRDAWEDHWRFFEAIVSGAMVMSDSILAMPAGMVDGESIVIYHNMTHLEDQLQYYLDPSREAERISIATKGRFIAMDRHRSWHRMEAIALGEIRSNCSVSRFPECPYTVHAA
jgi:Glycosyl transferases group 1